MPPNQGLKAEQPGLQWGVSRQPFGQWTSGVLERKKMSLGDTRVFLPCTCLPASLGTSRTGDTLTY